MTDLVTEGHEASQSCCGVSPPGFPCSHVGSAVDDDLVLLCDDFEDSGEEIVGEDVPEVDALSRAAWTNVCSSIPMLRISL